MKAAAFAEPGRIVLQDKPMPEVGPLDALLRITTTTICGASPVLAQRGAVLGVDWALPTPAAWVRYRSRA